jgi:WS/DGAT/MGAT family acyltransferase
MAEALSPSDLSALQAERGPVHMHVGGVLAFDGPVEREAVVRRLRERVHLIPRYAMRLESPPLGIANPVWVEDESFDPERHVRRAALPAAGGDAELCELVGHVLSEPLDRERPLWQLTVVEGLAGGRSALVAKMHHALVDGVAAVDVSTVVLDPTPEGLDLPPPEPRATPRPTPARPLVLSQLIASKVISKPAPPYPPLAVATRTQGTVTVEILVDEEGRVVSAAATSGPAMLREAARQAALRARFTPTQLNGQPVKVSGVISYNFVLQ